MENTFIQYESPSGDNGFFLLEEVIWVEDSKELGFSCIKLRDGSVIQAKADVASFLQTLGELIHA